MRFALPDLSNTAAIGGDGLLPVRERPTRLGLKDAHLVEGGVLGQRPADTSIQGVSVIYAQGDGSFYQGR